MALAGAYLVVKTAEYTKKAKGHERVYITGGLLIIALLLSFVYLAGNPLTQSAGSYVLSSQQATQVGSLLNDQWENAMAWVRNDTPIGSVFLHWWDYGYILQTIGLRPTVLDGGNYDSYWDHLMGRYVLTTPNPNTAFAFMKSQNVSYLLIDFTDFGKYSAFSSIGSDASGIDRLASPTVMAADPSQDYNTGNGTLRAYAGETFVDQDIVYQGTFLPGPSSSNGQVSGYGSYVIGATITYLQTNGSIGIQQPQAVFYYNNQRYALPMRYVYYNNTMEDFGSGINATFMIIPSLNVSQNGQVQVDPIGAGIYLSPKVQQTLYARLYLMNDPYKQYTTFSLANIQENNIVTELRSHGINVGDFLYYQGNLLAPLKIWKTTYPSDILNLPQFRQPNGTYADLDNLTLTD